MTPDLPPPVEEVVEVSASLQDWAEQACAADKVEVQWTGLQADVLPAETDRLVWQGDPCRSRPSVRVVAVSNDLPIARFTLQPSLSLWRAVPVATSDVQAGEAVTTELALVELASIRGRSAEAGIARVAIAAGRPVTESLLSDPVDANSGESVSLVYRSGNLVIEADGRLLEDGLIGEPVRVVNAASQRVAVGVLGPGRTVEMRR